MKTENLSDGHTKTLLASHNDCSVLYCSKCDALELNLAALTLRISPESLRSLSTVMNHAKVKLAKVQNSSTEYDGSDRSVFERFH